MRFVNDLTLRNGRASWLSAAGIIVLGFACGCSAESTSLVGEAATSIAEVPVVLQQAEAEEAAEPTPTYSQKLAAALEKAAAAKDAVVDQLSAAGESGSQAASDSVAWAAEMFHSLKEQGLTQAENTQEWLANDWKHAGAWEYQVVKLNSNDAAAARLNELGAERWECFHVTTTESDDGSTFYFKRPAQSYLNSLPMKDLMHLLPLMGSGKAGE